MAKKKEKAEITSTRSEQRYHQVAVQPDVYRRLQDFTSKRETYSSSIERLLNAVAPLVERAEVSKKKVKSKKK